MCILDISIINIAIPSIQKELDVATASLQWLITAYVLTYGGFLLVGGRLGDLYGRRRMLLGGLTIFTLASAIGGVSTNIEVLLLSRAGQGFGGAIITPTVMSFIAGLFPEGAERNRALGLLGAVTGAGFALGLVLGGLLTSTVGWRWVFFINLPIGIAVIVSAIFLLSETEREQQAVNIPGALLAICGLALATYTLSGVDRFGFVSFRTLGQLAIAALILYLFVVVERKSAHPLVPSGLLKHKALVRAVIGSTTFGAIVGPTTFILTLYLQNISQLNPLRTGLAYLPQEVTVFAAANLAGYFVGRFGSKKVLVGGIVALGGGNLLLTQLSSAGGYVNTVLPGLLLVGFGIGGVNVAGSIAATEGIPSLQHGISSGIWNTGTQIGTALGLAVLTAVAAVQTDRMLRLTPHIDNAVAVVSGYKIAFAIGGGLALLGLVCLFLVDRPVVKRRVEGGASGESSR